MAVVGHKKATAQQIVAELFCLSLGQSPLAHLHRIEPRPVVYFVAVVQTYRLLNRPGIDARKPPHRVRKGTVSPRIVLRPERKSLLPWPVEAPAITVQRPRRVHQARKGPLTGCSPVQRQRN